MSCLLGRRDHRKRLMRARASVRGMHRSGIPSRFHLVLNEVESEAVGVSAYDLCHGTNTATTGLFPASPALLPRAAAATFCASDIGTGSIRLTRRVESAARLNLDCRAGR